MSIKAIHIILISCAVILSFGFGLWLLATAKSTGEQSYNAAAVTSFLVAVGLGFYGVHFLKKAKALL